MEVGTSDPFPCWDNVPTLDTFFFEGFPKVIRFFFMLHRIKASNDAYSDLWLFFQFQNQTSLVLFDAQKWFSTCCNQ